MLTYETVDVSQIDAMMEGRVPGPPLDWAKSGKTSKDDKSGTAGPIGGTQTQS